jgi:uncharacterized protein (TIGR04255 family)
MPSLPSYRNPPVVEVAAGVQFKAIEWLIAPRLGLLWDRFRNDFPLMEQHEPLPAAVERIGVRGRSGQINLTLQSGKVTPRMWMLNEEGSELIQVQPDRLHRNWRKYQDAERKYPRYQEHIRPSFLESLQQFRQFLIDNEAGDLKATQCELVYVNHIRQGGVWRDHRDLSKVFRCWSSECLEAWGDQFESVNFVARKLIQSASGEFLGRLHLQAEPGFTQLSAEHPEDERIFLLTITARGRPTVDGDEGVVRFLDRAHEEIVTAFDEVTTPDMHRVWGKE